jgi:glucose/arabinose dehydrogenase
MSFQAASIDPGRLQSLPTEIRPRIDPKDIELPPAYVIEPLVVGLSFPICMEFGPEGELYIGEGGSTWPTRPAGLPRILRLRPSGKLDHFATMNLAGPRGMAVRDGRLYVSSKGGYFTRIEYYDLKTAKPTVLFDKIPDGGWHEPGGPLIGPHDGLLYFAQGSVAQNGLILPSGFTVDIAKHPFAKDVPGRDVVLTGNNVKTRDPTKPFPFLTETGAFKPFGEPARRGEVVKGELWCSTGVWRSTLDGKNPELIAWGIRNPFGLAFDERGTLYASDNDYEEKGERAIAQDPDRVWRIDSSREPHGSVSDPPWYGYPDIAGDGEPVWHESHLPLTAMAATQQIENPPPWAGPAAWLCPPHTALCRMDFCRTDAFGPGHRGKLFLAEFGTYAPLNSPRPEQLTNGFAVVEINVEDGTDQVFLRNKHPGPATSRPGSGGIERPVDCKFGPDGRTLYVLDFGVNAVDPSKVLGYAHTGVLWRVTYRGN